MKMDCAALFWGPLFISFFFSAVVFFLSFLHLIQTLENCMSTRMILNANAIIFICKYAKM